MPEITQADGRFLPSGDEAGTAPGDRKFRPDVEGLRAVAVLLVVLFHADVPWLTGGFVGVDVFFVLSGFVITGLLLRERATSGATKLLSFYGRRSRRILPAATVVIVLTVLASYHWLGFITGDATAQTGRTASLFYSNFPFHLDGHELLGLPSAAVGPCRISGPYPSRSSSTSSIRHSSLLPRWSGHVSTFV